MSSSPFRKIDRADPLVEVVLAQISQAIIVGDLRPGDKLLEMQLGEQLGVSRGPIREAIRRLEQMRVVEKIPYRGTYVSRLSQTDLDELHSIRAVLEALAVKLIIKQQDPATIQELRTIIERMHEAAQTKDRARMIVLDAEFHGALITHSHHKILQELWDSIRIRLHSFLLLKTKRLYSSLNEAAQIHDTIVTAIESGDMVRATAEIQHHIDEAYKEMIENWSPDLAAGSD
ncbi:MAG: GntR family transcriptional regulator [Chloroflexi bacterium]|nr:GntR family transcriptional regulator [Chloroflexota bacterium]